MAADGNVTGITRESARAEAYRLPIEKLNPAQPELFQADAMWPIFERLRAEDPIHYTEEHEFGPYWSITKYNDIMAIDTDHGRFSSDFMKGGITIAGGQANMDPLPMFIAMDPPKHDVQRKAVTPAVSPHALLAMGPEIRQRAAAILDSLPIGEVFDWVDLVSKELTAMTLATLFDAPQADRRKITHCPTSSPPRRRPAPWWRPSSRRWGSSKSTTPTSPASGPRRSTPRRPAT